MRRIATGYLPVLQAGYDSVAPRGSLVFIGTNNNPVFKLDVDVRTHMMNGTRLLGCVEGDSVPAEVKPSVLQGLV